ncbi:MAG: ABC transporter substrate-binding protein [Chloroflexota bacterium]
MIGVLALFVMACTTPAATPTAPSATATPAPATATPAATPTEEPTPGLTAEPPVTAPPTETPAAAACEGQSLSFMLSFLANIQHAGFLVAETEGYYDEEGLDVTITPAGPGIDVAAAVADGTADLGQIDYVPLVEARAAGVPVKAVGQIYKDPFFFWYSSGDGGPATIADWAGARVGAIQVGAYPERDAMLIAGGADPEDITVVPQDFDGLLDPETMDIAEGVVFFHPALINLVGMPPFPDSYNVFRPAELGADFASQTVAGNETYLGEHPDAVACFLRASIRGWQDAFTDAQGAVDATMTFVPEGSPITPGHQLAALPDVLAITGTGADDATLLQPDANSYQATIDQLVTLGQLDADPGVDTTFDGSFWDAAVAGMQ